MDHAHIGIKTGLCILFHNPGEAADLGIQAGSGDLPDAVKLSFGGDGKSGLNDIHAEFVNLPGDPELLVRSERYAGSLLSVPESGVKNADFFINKQANVVEDDSPQRFLVSWMSLGSPAIKLLPLWLAIALIGRRRRHKLKKEALKFKMLIARFPTAKNGAAGYKNSIHKDA